ncbi:MAG: DUF4126 domain-containing protein [Deltaproteobacteria bacterium]|nr:DUF4126 domain-containing protein [Deltaproteobacteria bacterium]
MEALTLLGGVTGIALFAGIRLYATVLTVGLCLRYGLLVLPPELSSLSVLAHPHVLVVAGFCAVVEFLADKVPWVDSLWDAIHAFVRPAGAALIAFAAVGRLDPAVEVAFVLLCGGVAFFSHAAKAGIRLLVNQSPEPFSNLLLSLIEDGLVVGGSYFAVAHPLAALFLVVFFLVLFALLARRILRRLRKKPSSQP